MKTKGFTLLELVIVIGILAVLGAISVLVLNPAQLFAQARDTTRIEDMGVLRNALAMYVSMVSSPTMGPACSTNCYVGADLGVSAGCAGAGSARHGTKTATYSAARTVGNGAGGNLGWLPVDLGAVPGGPALSVLPIDPSNGTTYFYSYACENTAKTFELNANMESQRYSTSGSDDKESNTKDGGNNDSIYEIGTDAGLDL